MSDEAIKISSKTWDRAINSINKVGYSDGVVEGQSAAFQPSFDMGYRLGFEFGFNLGLKKANQIIKQNEDKSEDKLLDPRRINCQICLNHDISSENIVNLYNKQLEENKNNSV